MTALIRLYSKFISPLFPNCCRFTPSCSAYTHQAIKKYGFLKGVILGAWRILRCNPWHKCEHEDPVPDNFTFRQLIKRR
jgi:putative membrane protein insertion efficiency factor